MSEEQINEKMMRLNHLQQLYQSYISIQRTVPTEVIEEIENLQGELCALLIIGED